VSDQHAEPEHWEPYRTEDEHPPAPVQTRTVDEEDLDSPMPVAKGDVVYIDDKPHQVVELAADGSFEVVAL